jgi:sensor histidine kinase YesM
MLTGGKKLLRRKISADPQKKPGYCLSYTRAGSLSINTVRLNNWRPLAGKISVIWKNIYFPVLSKLLFKYRLYHIPFWCIYFALFLSPFVLKLSFYIPIQLLAVYFNLYFLIPEYLEKGKYNTYIFGLVATLLGASLCIVSGYYVTAFFAHSTLSQLYGPGLCTYYFFGNAVPAVFATLTLTTCIRLTKVWIQTQRRQQMLEKEQLETELNFLKHQFNPHFLFNTINSIFFLIHKRPDAASESLVRFSDLLRYQLYECNDRQIPLSKEIGFLKNSIELEKLRQNDTIRISLQADRISLQAEAPSFQSDLYSTSGTPQSTDHLGIAPFILMTFVENAFKHVSSEPDMAGWITMELGLDHHRLSFSVANSIVPGAIGSVINNSGVGLKNVRRRLDLLYPGGYDLNIRSDSVSFEVRLRLDLSPMAPSSSPVPMPPPSTADRGLWVTA